MMGNAEGTGRGTWGRGGVVVVLVVVLVLVVLLVVVLLVVGGSKINSASPAEVGNIDSCQ